MSGKREVVVVGGARTAIGTFGGSLKDFAPVDLATLAVKTAIARAKVDPARVGHLYMGTAIPTERRDTYLSRVASLNAGMVQESCAMNVNRLCGSGFQAIVSAAQSILLGDADAAIGAGAESMSRGGYLVPSARWGARMGDAQMIDMMVGALTDPFSTDHMGITAENVAARWHIGREEQDQFALASQQKAVAAIAAGHFKSQIVPVEIKTRKGVVQFDTDEYPKADASLEALAKLKPAFKRDGGVVTAGNASGINDGAAAVVLMEAGAAAQAGIKPLARLVSYGIAGVEPSYMGEGPIPAVKLAMQRAGLKFSDLAVIESNEAFAAQSICVNKGLDLDPSKVNPNGGAIALGHPVGATGAILAVKCIYELERTGGRYGLVTMCIGGGQGIAGIFERL
ncbi:MAG: acetyl-CoA C-acyltransferase family protein [Proteobacteria bacterium]|nr:acetyl-CoA C-acyltransferase family protein [Pseudomonadota bacterium]HQR04058.1 acetyl-CoA C-acyltransferase family protein [Rhodocyclaceae bacterium]